MKKENLLPQVNFGVTKAEIADMVNLVVAQLSDGDNYSTDKVLQVAENLSAMADFAKKLKEDDRFRKLVRDVVDKHGKKYVSSSGAEIENVEAGVKYDYSSSESWRELQYAIERLVAKQKKIEEMMRAVAPGNVIVDNSTGETIGAAMKKSTPTFKVSLKSK